VRALVERPVHPGTVLAGQGVSHRIDPRWSSEGMPTHTPNRTTPSATTIRPVLYLDIDDTLVTYSRGRPEAAPGARDFLLWALEHFEVRWLTTWCPSGTMDPDLSRDFCHMLKVEPDVIGRVRGHDWAFSSSKLDGIIWLEHLVLGRPFLWVEDDYGAGDLERDVLERLGLGASLLSCNVTRDTNALVRLHERLKSRCVPEGC
jgi:hypothetical protein